MKHPHKQEEKTPHFHGHRKRLRQKFLTSPESLADYELLELLLTYSIPRKDVKPLAKQLLAQFKNIHGVMNASLEKLCELPEISDNTLSLLQLFKELDLRSLAVEMEKKDLLTSPEDVITFASKKLGSRPDEAFMIIYINARNKVENYEILNEGTVDRAVVYTRNIIKSALKHNATGIIMVHNHPSGECEPSGYDIRMTEEIIKAAASMDIRVLDHLIVASHSYFSFNEHDLL